MEPEGPRPVTRSKPTLVRRISNISRSYLAAMLPGLMGGNWSEENSSKEQQSAIIQKDEISLTQKQKLLIKRTWRTYAADLKENGIELFKRFFADHPAYKDLFPALRDLDADELEASLFVRAHSLTVLHSIMSMVDNIDDKKRLQAILNRTARIHYGFGIRFIHFETMLQLLLEALAEKVAVEWDSSAETAWILFFDAMRVVISEKMIEMEKKKKASDRAEENHTES